jgi:hypothetical protein
MRFLMLGSAASAFLRESHPRMRVICLFSGVSGVLAKWQTFAIFGLSRSVPMILDISGKAAHALRQYLQLVITNYELAMDEQNAKDRQRYLMAGWHAASPASAPAT